MIRRFYIALSIAHNFINDLLLLHSTNNIWLSKIPTQKKSESKPGIAGHINFRPSSIFPVGNNFLASYGLPGSFLDTDLRVPRTFTATMKFILAGSHPIIFRARDMLRVIDLPPFSRTFYLINNFSRQLFIDRIIFFSLLYMTIFRGENLPHG